MNNVKIEVHNFQSTPQRYAGNEGQYDLELQVMHCGQDAVKIQLIDKFCKGKGYKILKQLFYLLVLYGVYCILTKLASRGNSQKHLINTCKRSIVDFCFVFYLLYLISKTYSIRKKEKLFFCANFGIQLETELFLSRRTSSFIPAASIHDVCINEVIENIDIRYILILRSKGMLFKEKPIIAVFNAMSPTLECLEFIYKIIRSKIQNTTD